MKIACRKSVFETNSSSVHSISILPFTGEVENELQGYGDEITIYLDSFDLGLDVLTTWTSKLSYLLSLATTIGDVENVEKEVCKALGINKINMSDKAWVSDSSYRKKFLDRIMQDEQSIRDYLFGNGVVIIDNDNRDFIYTLSGYGFEIETIKTGGRDCKEVVRDNNHMVI